MFCYFSFLTNSDSNSYFLDKIQYFLSKNDALFNYLVVLYHKTGYMSFIKNKYLYFSYLNKSKSSINLKSYLDLAICYLDEIGTNKDLKKALFYINKITNSDIKKFYICVINLFMNKKTINIYLNYLVLQHDHFINLFII